MIYPTTETALDSLLSFLAGEGHFVFLDTGRLTPEDHRSYLFLRPESRLVCKKTDQVDEFFKKAEDYLAQGYYLAGWFAYEFAYLLEPVLLKNLENVQTDTPLASLGVFKEPHVFDHLRGSFAGAGPWPVSTNAALADFQVADLRLNEEQERYFTNLRRIKSYIETGDTYQVNYTLKLLFSLSGMPEMLYKTLRRGQSVSYGAYLREGSHRVMSFSPELFFKKEKACCTVRPMKGTSRRGVTLDEDARSREFLQQDIKNRSENIMIVDLLRNDLGRICRPGTVTTESLFDIETYETLHQMTSTVKGTVAEGVSLEKIFRSLFPCGSVTGAPKIRTMQIIHELESSPRNIYTGAIGFITPTGEMKFNVPIRTLVLQGNKGEMGLGSGVVYDSDAQKEWDECNLKGRFLSSPAPDFQLIETMLWQPGSGFWLLPEHLERLEQSAAYFGFHCAKAQIMEQLLRLAGNFAEIPQRVRLTLAKDGSTHLSATACARSPISVLPEKPSVENLARVKFAESAVDTNSPYTYHKTTLRDLYDRERQKALAEGYFEVFFTNTGGEVTEGSITNIFIRKNGKIFTPPLASGLLNGVFRRYFLKNCSLPIEEKILRPQELLEADAIYAGNSVRGLTQVEIRED